MLPLTIFLGKVLGLTYLLTCLVCMARPTATLDAANSMAKDTGLLLVSGIDGWRRSGDRSRCWAG